MPVARLLKGLFLALVVTVLTIVGAALWLSDGDLLVDALQGMVARLTPYELQVAEPQLAWGPLRFQSPLVLLRYADPQKPPVVSIQQLDVSLPLQQLIWGDINAGYLNAQNISYYLDSSSDSEPLDLEGLLLPLARLPQRIEVDSVHLIAGGEQLWVFPLLGLTAQRQEDGAIRGAANALIGARQVNLSAVTRWELADDGAHFLELRGSITDRDGVSRLDLDGRINADGAQLSYGFDLNGHYARVGDFLTAFDEAAFPFQGDLLVDGRLEGDLSGYVLTINDITLTTGEAYRFSASGQASRRGHDPVALELRARGDARDLQELLPLPDPVTDLVEDSTLLMEVRGTLNTPVIDTLGVELRGPDGATLTLTATDQTLALDDLKTLNPSEPLDAEFLLEVPMPATVMSRAGMPAGDLQPADLRAMGRLRGDAREFALMIDNLSLAINEAPVRATGEIIWRENTLSARSIDLDLQLGNGEISASGAIADLIGLNGLGLDLRLAEVDGLLLFETFGQPAPWIAATRPSPIVNGSALIQRPGSLLIARDLDVQLRGFGDLEIHLKGEARSTPLGPEADVALTFEGGTSVAWSEVAGIPAGPDSGAGKIRLRPGYLTALGDLQLGPTALQAVLSADLNDGRFRELGLDLYSPSLDVASLLPDKRQREPSDDRPLELASLRESLPSFPVHLTLRADDVHGALTELQYLGVAVDLRDDRILLRELDSLYAGGELSLRGVVDLSGEAAAISLAGRGIRVPLGAITRDLDLQESVTGDLSLRGGIATQGTTLERLVTNLSGNLSLAMTDTTISGAAYDLLMSNLLAWIAQGNRETTTTFDCTMASFEISEGVLRSDDLYVETPRMVASGKARMDIPAERLDVRLEPRSKSRTLQFPSAVRIRGPLMDPKVSVSAMQTTADLSAQALLLLPSLPLKLFGLGSSKDQLLPCETVVSSGS